VKMKGIVTTHHFITQKISEHVWDANVIVFCRRLV
jgi:hypothetical protein